MEAALQIERNAEMLKASIKTPTKSNTNNCQHKSEMLVKLNKQKGLYHDSLWHIFLSTVTIVLRANQ